MKQVLTSSWALLLGVFLLMLGNGLQGTLLGVRGALENFSPLTMSFVMAGYFLGIMIGGRAAPSMIQRVGHIRVFAALGSLVSAVLILFPVLIDPIAWAAGRVILGFCFSGMYVTAESWLNGSTDNDHRGQALSVYMMVQMAGVVAAQQFLNFADAGGYILFIIPSVLVSLAFTPILLSVTPTPAFETTKPMSMRQLFVASPLTFVGMFFLGGVFSAQFGMSAVFGTEAGLSVGQISTFISVIYIAAVIAQYPIGWLSDRMDRRYLILFSAALGAAASVLAIFHWDNFTMLLISGAIMGGTSNPLYSLLLAYINDYLDYDDMAAASGGLLFVNGVGAVFGPLIVGWLMAIFGPAAFWAFIAWLMGLIAIYAAYRATQRATPDDQGTYAPVSASASVVAVEVAQEVYIEEAEAAAEDEEVAE